MKTVQIDLPDALADEAAVAGLLAPVVIERVLRRELRNARIGDLAAARDRFRSDPSAPMTGAEIAAEVTAYRAERRHAAGS